MSIPDLQILVHCEDRRDGLALTFQLKAQNPELGLNYTRFVAAPLRPGTEEFVHQLLEDVSKLPMLLDRREEALSELEEAVQLVRRSGSDETLAHALICAAVEYLHAGLDEGCRSCLDEASILVDPDAMRLLAIDVALIRARLAIADGDADAARTLYRFAAAEIESTNYGLWRPWLGELERSLTRRSR